MAIEPSSPAVPANLLRAYVHFSVPMRTDIAADYVRLVDEEGETVAMPYVEVDGGLWDRDATRLTLLFHPGRIKRPGAPSARRSKPGGGTGS